MCIEKTVRFGKTKGLWQQGGSVRGYEGGERYTVRRKEVGQ